MSNAIVSLDNVSKSYVRGKQTIDVLTRLSFEIATGEFIALMGPSGSGKTTLLNLIGGLDTPTSGQITVAGQRLDQLSGGGLARWRSNHVGFVFQFYNLMPMLSAQRNVELPLLLTRLSAAQRRSNALAALTLVGIADKEIAELQRELGTQAEVIIDGGNVPELLNRAAESTNADLLIVGAYPDNARRPDMHRGKPAEHDATARAVSVVPLPSADPVVGGDGPLQRLWGG